MSHHIPFDIQAEIVKRLPVIPLIRFRLVSKQWKSLIESYEFINDHKCINIDRSQCYIIVRHKFNGEEPQYTSIIDDDTFPNKKSSLNRPPPLSSLPYRFRELVSSVNGLSCFHGFPSELKKPMAVLWNPIIRKAVGIVIPSGSNNRDSVIGFGFCNDTSDPKLVKVNSCYKDKEVMVFTLSSRVWKSVFNVLPDLGPCRLTRNQVCIKGCIYWSAVDNSRDDEPDVIVSFDLESEKFGLVRGLPECLLKTNVWKVAEVNESLGLLVDDYYDDQGRYYDEDGVCSVWMMDLVTKSFTKMFTIKQPWPFHGVHGVLGFRKNGEVIIEAQEDCRKKSRLGVYEPSTGCINDIGINGKTYEQTVSLYQETLLLLNETSSIIPL